MSIRNLEFLFDPASVAVIGASARPDSIGSTVWRNLRAGGYKGRLDAVNARHAEIDGIAAHASVAALPQAPELAVICTPPATVPGLISALVKCGTRAAVVLSAGLDAKQKSAMLAAARPGLLRLLGPDSLGLQAPHLGLNASYAPAAAAAGSLAFVSQSGALVTAMLDWARDRGIGFSQVVALGEQADIDFGDMLDFLASDPRTRAILLYIESAHSARKFMSAARAAARNKPVIVVKTGRSAAGRLAATAHSGIVAGDDAVFDAAIRRAGMLRVDTLQDLFMAAETLSRYHAVPRGRPADIGVRDAALTILTNGGGAGVLAADAAALAGIELAAPGAALDPGRPHGRTRGNPVDLGGEASVERHVQALSALLADPASGTLLFIHAPSALVPSRELAAALLPLVSADPARLFCCWLGDPALTEARRSFHDAGVPSFDTPEEAVRAFSMLQTYRRNQELLLEAPPAAVCALAPDIAAVRQIVATVLAERREALSDAEARAVLAACRIEVGQDVAPLAQDLYVGAGIDAVFGPTIAFGASGASAQAQADRALALPPLNVPLARELVSRTRVGRRLADTHAAAPGEALLSLLTTLSQLLADVPEIAELAIEPLRLAAHGTVAHGTRIRVSAAAPGGAGNFAVRPYPAQLSEQIAWRGRTLTLRPVRPEDEAQHLDFLGRLDSEDLRMRIFYSRRTIERSELARLTQIDYEREMAFLATALGADGAEETLAVARAVADPDNREAEFGIIVRSDLKGGGLGHLLMTKLIAYLRSHGTQRLVATVLKENQGMLGLARALGFVVDQARCDGDTHAIHLDLQS